MKLTKLFIFFNLIYFPLIASAKDVYVYPSIFVSELIAKKLNEQSGDELFFEIIELNQAGQTFYSRIPEFPLYWKNDQLKKIKNTRIWSGLLKEEEESTLYISLIEQDAPPWDLDDNLGTLKLELKNENGSLKSKWSMENKNSELKIVAKKSDHIQNLKMERSGAKYSLTLGITEKNDFLEDATPEKSERPQQHPYQGFSPY